MPKPPRSKAYLAFVRAMPCCVCGARPPSEAAHGDVHALSVKGSDLEALPLCGVCHRTGRFAQHKVGWRRFAEVWELDLAGLRASLRGRFERSR